MSSFAFVDCENVNNLDVKAEPIEENFEIENDSLDTPINSTCRNSIKSEPESVEELESLRVVENNIFSDSHCIISVTAAAQVEALNKSKAFGTQQIEIIKSENNETKCKNEYWPEVVYEDWKIKHEELDLKEEELLENEINVSSERRIQEKHDDFNKLKSSVCDPQTKWKRSVKKHLLPHRNLEGVDLFGCDKCLYRTRYKSALKVHDLKHKNSEELNLFRCDKCEYRTPNKFNLNRHILRHKNPGEVDLLKCDKCEYRTFFEYDFRSHTLRHENLGEVDLFRCDKCEYRTPNTFNLKRHLLRHKNH